MAKQKDGDYEVGYGKPPKHTQYQPGQSGNGGGRPRKADKVDTASLADMVFDALRRPICITENGRKRYVTVQEAIVQTMLAHALKGNTQAFRMAFKLFEIEGKSEKGVIWPDLTNMDAKGAAEAYKRLMSDLGSRH